MQVISVNIGQERTIVQGDRIETTGIYKLPASGPVLIGRYGLQGDTIVDREHHGGVDQAVYVYGSDDYAWWAAELGYELAPGTFGENLTIGGLASAGSAPGDRLHVGATVLEVTAPRIPCSTFAARMGDPAFVKRFRQAERPGFYCRVIREGQVSAGDPVAVERYAGESLEIGQMFRSYYDDQPDEETIRRHLAAPIAVRTRAKQEQRLQKLLAGRP